MKLSDIMIHLLDFLGPRVLIADPYYINNIKQDEATKSALLTDCQLSFLNAVIHSAVTKGVNSLTIMGYNARANQHFDKDEELVETTTQQRVNRYRQLFKNLIANNHLEPYLPTGSVRFQNAPSDFHSRYWFGYAGETNILDKCVIITNSIGNMEEVDFIQVTHPGQLQQITHRYSYLLNQSTNELSI